jgi:hypothetical protein
MSRRTRLRMQVLDAISTVRRREKRAASRRKNKVKQRNTQMVKPPQAKQPDRRLYFVIDQYSMAARIVTSLPAAELMLQQLMRDGRLGFVTEYLGESEAVSSQQKLPLPNTEAS